MKCWEISVHPLRHSVRIRYWGPTPTDALTASLAELNNAMPKAPTTLVIDIRELVGLNPDSRELWQTFLANHKRNLEAVYLVVPHAWAIHRMIASVMGLAVGLRLRLVESTDEIR
jgi:hypothetical protein